MASAGGYNHKLRTSHGGRFLCLRFASDSNVVPYFPDLRVMVDQLEHSLDEVGLFDRLKVARITLPEFQ